MNKKIIQHKILTLLLYKCLKVFIYTFIELIHCIINVLLHSPTAVLLLHSSTADVLIYKPFLNV